MSVPKQLLLLVAVPVAAFSFLACEGLTSQVPPPMPHITLASASDDDIFGHDPLEAGQRRYQLPIEARQQWTENNGYCGETSLQQGAMLFGTYMSQFVCRAISDPTQKHDVLIDQGAVHILDTIKLKSDTFDNSGTKPQYERYLVWVKRHIAKGHPVLLSVFSNHGSADDYDHIVLVNGLASSDLERFRGSDRFIFDDHFASDLKVARADTFFDTRAMDDNGSKSKYCVPADLDYGCAVTGLQDQSEALCPVQVQLDRSDEPDVIAGDEPVTLQAKVLVSGLTPGRDYVLYRFDQPGDVPTRSYSHSHYHSASAFRATGFTQQFQDSFASNGFAAYRCEKASAEKDKKTPLGIVPTV